MKKKVSGDVQFSIDTRKVTKRKREKRKERKTNLNPNTSIITRTRNNKGTKSRYLGSAGKVHFPREYGKKSDAPSTVTVTPDV